VSWKMVVHPARYGWPGSSSADSVTAARAQLAVSVRMARPRPRDWRDPRRPTVDELVARYDQVGATDPEYRRLSTRVRGAVRRLLAGLSKVQSAAYMRQEETRNERDAYVLDSVARWAYLLGRRDLVAPMPRVRGRKRAVNRLRRPRKAPTA
jgi:hypothetical protein